MHILESHTLVGLSEAQESAVRLLPQVVLAQEIWTETDL